MAGAFGLHDGDKFEVCWRVKHGNGHTVYVTGTVKHFVVGRSDEITGTYVVMDGTLDPVHPDVRLFPMDFLRGFIAGANPPGSPVEMFVRATGERELLPDSVRKTVYMGEPGE